MAGLEISSNSIICRRCGEAYGRNKGNFLVSRAALYKGTGYLPYCKRCVEEMFQEYLMNESISSADAVRQVCRKLDLYWNEAIFNSAEKVSTVHSLITSYISKLSAVKYAGKCYDDTLREENALWIWPNKYDEIEPPVNPNCVEPEDDIDVPDEIVSFWGPGYSSTMYLELEDRFKYWISKYPENYQLDPGEEALLRQICNLEIDINHERAAGKPIDKIANTLNSILGSANLKPSQKKDDADAELENMPLGVGIQKWEFNRPLPETEKSKRDIRGVIRNITTWYLGHACKMVGLRNSYTKMYEDAMNEYRVSRPEYDEEDDDTLLSDIFGSSSESGDQ